MTATIDQRKAREAMDALERLARLARQRDRLIYTAALGWGSALGLFVHALIWGCS